MSLCLNVELFAVFDKQCTFLSEVTTARSGRFRYVLAKHANLSKLSITVSKISYKCIGLVLLQEPFLDVRNVFFTLKGTRTKLSSWDSIQDSFQGPVPGRSQTRALQISEASDQMRKHFCTSVLLRCSSRPSQTTA